MKEGGAAAAHAAATGLLGVEMIMPRRTRDNLAPLRDAQALHIGLIRFHIEAAPRRGRAIIHGKRFSANREAPPPQFLFSARL